MDLLTEIVIRVLGILVGRYIEPVESPSNTPWYTKLIHTILILTTIAGLLISLYFFPSGILGILMVGEYSQPWQAWVYVALMLLLPFFNSAILIWTRKLPINPWAITATIGMVISANLPVWTEFLRASKQLRWDFNIFTAILAICSLAFLMSIALFALAAKRTPTAKRKLPYDFIKEPKFLDAIDDLKTQKRKPSFNELEQRPHEV